MLDKKVTINAPNNTGNIAITTAEGSASIELGILSSDSIPRVLTLQADLPPMVSQRVSREDEQKYIRELICKKKKLVLVNGLGGVGKSTVCQELFHQMLGETELKGLAWVNYGGESLFDDFVNQFCYPKLRIDRRESIEYFIQNEIDESAVIFVDNLNVRDIEEPFLRILEKAKCSVVCTSRITDYRYFETVPIDLFPIEKCIELFKKYAGISDEEKGYDEYITNIVSRVGQHTLTIEILGKIALAEEWKPPQILEYLKERGIDLEGIAQVDLKEDTLVGHLCRIFPVDKLDDTRRYILAHFSNCSMEQIPKNMKDWLGLSGKHHINYLKKYGWFVENSQSYYMHPIIKEAVRRVCSLEMKDYTELVDSLETLTHYQRNKGVSEALPYYSYIKSILDQIKDMVTPQAAQFNFNFAVIEEEIQNYNSAIKFFEKALAVWKHPEMKKYKEDWEINTKIANIQVQIGACYYYLKNNNDARLWYDKTDKMEGTYRDKELTIQLYNNYALTYQADFRVADEQSKQMGMVKRNLLKAMFYFEKTISGFQKMGKQDEFTAMALRNAGQLYLEQNQHQLAINYFRKSLEIREKHLAPLSPNLERSYFSLARAFEGLGDELTNLIGKKVKYSIAFRFYFLSHEICKKNEKDKTNKVHLDELEQHIISCREKLNVLCK